MRQPKQEKGENKGSASYSFSQAAHVSWSIQKCFPKFLSILPKIPQKKRFLIFFLLFFFIFHNLLPTLHLHIHRIFKFFCSQNDIIYYKAKSRTQLSKITTPHTTISRIVRCRWVPHLYPTVPGYDRCMSAYLRLNSSGYNCVRRCVWRARSRLFLMILPPSSLPICTLDERERNQNTTK